MIEEKKENKKKTEEIEEYWNLESKGKAFQLSMQAVNPWTWWPVDGIPIPTQPMMKLGADGEYVPNEEYDPMSISHGRPPAWLARSGRN